MRIADTTFVVDLLRGRRKAAEKLGEITSSSGTILLPTPVVHELYYGAGKTSDPARERERLRELERTLPALPMSPDEARLAGRLDAELELEGNPIGRFDLQVAAAALTRAAPVVSRDQHFHRVPNLDIEPY